MTAENPTIADLYVTETPHPGIRIVRLNPKTSPEDRVDIVASQRLAHLARAIGQEAASHFSKNDLIKS